MRKTVMAILVTSLFALLLAGCSSDDAANDAGDKEEPDKADSLASVRVVDPVVALGDDIEVVLLGSGFEPGQEVRFMLTTDQEGLVSQSDLTYDSDPAPVASPEGAFVTAWGALGRLADKGVVREGVYNIVVADSDNNPLATAAVALYDSEKPQEEWPAWAPSMSE